ncbi:MAG: phosphatase PAP2 family protein [Bacteroidales bacterium]|nr:phosphatase PAP2 family protein [Bacteroidales bacterium]
MEQIISIDKSVFWWINSHHSGWLDWTMWTFSQPFSWLIVILLVYILVTLRKDRRNWLWVLVGIGFCFLLADQISNEAIKEGVQRLRPCYELDGVRMFRTGKGGQYGFVSSHAANAFAVAMFLSLLYGGERKTENEKPGAKIENHKNAVIPYVMFAWAAIVCYSRAYLGKHYPGDIVCGALLGLGVGATVYFVISSIRRRIVSKSAE